MTILIVGATGATGKHVAQQLLEHGHAVKAIVRSPENLPDSIKGHENLTIIQHAVLDLTDADMQQHVQGCDAIVSCLGHNLTFKGLFGKPRRLVTDATRRLCQAVQANKPDAPVKFVLMNTTGNQNRDLHEPLMFKEKIVIGLIRLLLPPHVDNEKAADYLRVNIGQDNKNIEWTAVRPDNLIDEDAVSEYELYPSPIRSGIFNAGKTSRINVAHFMVDLIANQETWQNWKGQMPVIYNT
jgi:nucleoside-diphosphate-sugar epimerase